MAAIFAAMMLLTGPQEAADRSIDVMLDARGIEGLTNEQRIKIRKLIIDLFRTSRSEGGASASAEKYLEREGYRKCSLSLIRVEGISWLIHSSSYKREATKDLPFGLSTYGFRSGSYFCKTNFIGGPSEFIDDDGDVQRLLFAKWIDLK